MKILMVLLLTLSSCIEVRTNKLGQKSVSIALPNFNRNQDLQYDYFGRTQAYGIVVCRKLNQECLSVHAGKRALASEVEMIPELFIRAIPEGSYQKLVTLKDSDSAFYTELEKIFAAHKIESLYVENGQVGTYHGDDFKIKK